MGLSDSKIQVSSPLPSHRLTGLTGTLDIRCLAEYLALSRHYSMGGVDDVTRTSGSRQAGHIEVEGVEGELCCPAGPSPSPLG